jgi:hypothetical protein
MRRKLEFQTVRVKGNAKKLQSEEFYNSYSLRKGQLADAMATGGIRNIFFTTIRWEETSFMTKIQLPYQYYS